MLGFQKERCTTVMVNLEVLTTIAERCEWNKQVMSLGDMRQSISSGQISCLTCFVDNEGCIVRLEDERPVVATGDSGTYR